MHDNVAELQEITEELAGEEFAVRCGAASAVVDGLGTVVDLRIADEALTTRTLDLDALGADILDAIGRARQQAGEQATHLLRPVFPALFPEER